MFKPKYTISNNLLANIKRISALVQELNTRQFTKIVLVDLEMTARAVSAFASTSIEGNPLPLTEVKKILKNLPVNIRDSEREVLNYNEALEFSSNVVRNNQDNLTLDLILEIHKKVVTGLLPKYDVCKLRKKPVVVNNPKLRKIVYLPPDAQVVETLIKDLVKFVSDNENTIDSLILAGIFHKQMVVIHPFMDGNGRTTRLITKILLARMGLNTFNLFSFENYYNQNITKYFEEVGEYGDYNDLGQSIDFTSWLEYFTGGIIDELLRVKGLLPNSILSTEQRLEQRHRDLVDFVKKNGSITDREYAKITSKSKATRSLDFQKLTLLGLLERKGEGRATYYVLKDFR